MKNLLKSAAIAAVFTIVMSLNGFAQNTITQEPKTEENTSTLNLSDQQKEIFKANKEKREALRKDFKATLSAEQMAIMSEKSLTKAEKRKKLSLSLTPQQTQMREANKEIIKENRKAFVTTLTPQQKKDLKTKTKNWKEKRKANKADLDVVTGE